MHQRNRRFQRRDPFARERVAEPGAGIQAFHLRQIDQMNVAGVTCRLGEIGIVQQNDRRRG